ncbi:murein L,D-transpeptidase YafK [Clostridium algifaecis]|uniref:Murein L,D-transpeptidase YafK n=1 Tax=Clostridium algifaecis TaxID=1472040 RepID=A0ABS4KMU1_9CLOT|nr:L,D-transpeptidase family protein [Clostridium algifaecis]MBP2031357.1 murein L,D-transpeptidase YafK [Clostridium algifaecis]
MKNRDRIYPAAFFIFGVILIALVSGMSIKNYIKQNNNIKQVSANNKQKESQKIFFNRPQNDPENTTVKIYKSKNIMELYGDEKLIGRFKVGFGRVNKGYKEKEGDNKTPEGSYYVCYINPNSKYKYFFGISYPNEKDAKNGLDKNIINKITYNRIKDAIDDRRQPPWHTALGGEIGIHGGGTKSDWTYGCIAMENEDIYKVKEYIRLRTEVYIYK